MKKADAIMKAGGLGELANLLEITKSAISQWPDEVPSSRLYELRVKRPEWFGDADRASDGLAAQNPVQ